MGGFEDHWGAFYIILLGVLLGTLGISIVFLIKYMKQRVRSDSHEKWLEQMIPLGQVRNLTPNQFECFVAELFQKMGYLTNLALAPLDGEVDVLAVKGGQKHLIQCKGYSTKKIKRSEVRKFYKTLASRLIDHKGIIVTTGIFTPGAEKFAEKKCIELIDGTKLLRYMQRAGIGESLSPQARKRLQECK